MGRVKFSLIAFLLSFLVYLKTLSPTVYVGDSGEMITAAYTLGIAHPSGYPTWTMIGHLFTYIPFGSVAFRVNLMSAVFGALTVLFLYYVIRKLTKSPLAAFFSSLLFAFSSLFWSQAVIAEVYTLHAFFLVLNIFLLLKYRENYERKWIYLFSFTLGLSFTHHITSLFFVPAYLFMLRNKLKKFKIKPAIFCIALLILGMLPYAYLPIRSSMDPVVNFNNPENLDNFIFHVSGKEYRKYVNLGSIGESFLPFVKYLPSQLTIPGFLLMLYGFWLLFKRKETFIFLGLMFIFTFIHALSYVVPDPGVFFIPSLLILSIIIGFGVSGLITFIKKRIGNGMLFYIVLLTLFILLVAVPFAMNYKISDKHDFFAPYTAGMDLMNSAEENAIIVGGGDHFYTITLYLQEVEEKRPDLIILERVLLTRPWYFDKFKEELGVTRTGPERYRSRDPSLKSSDTLVKEIFDANFGKRPLYSTSNISIGYNLVKGDILYSVEK